MADDADRLAAKPAEAADDGLVVAELPVPGERREVLHQALDELGGMRPLWMARDLRLLPGCQLGVEFPQRLVRLGLEALDLVADGDGVAARRHGAQLLDLGLQFGDRLFEIEIAAHGAPEAARERAGN